MKQGSDYYFYQNDHLGTPQELTAINGAVVWSAKYSSFGKANVDGSSIITNNLRFPGQYHDAETGLHYNYNRYYDPKTGRYLRPDPIGSDGGDFNLYSYVADSPNNLIDPLGLQQSVYPGVNTPTPGDFVEVINHFLGFFNAVRLTNETFRQIDILAKTIPCKEVARVHVCFHPGPPPYGVQVGLGDAISSPKLRCVGMDIKGTKDCPCEEDKNLYWRQG